MGQSKKRQETHASMLAGGPPCIYCAGANVATTIEHMPPVNAFAGRQRPKGLEFPACRACNNGTGHSDLVAAMLARSWPDADSAIQKEDLRRILSGVANNLPGLLEEMQVGRASQKIARKRFNIPSDAYPFRAGPIIDRYILTFAAKLGFALHYDVNGEPIPSSGGALVMWFSNVQALNKQIPQELFDLLASPPKTLQQGAKSVGEQFQYKHANGERDHMLYFASFNQSFAVAGVTAKDRAIILDKTRNRFPIYSPGDLQTR
jgi:hypothetical protein